MTDWQPIKTAPKDGTRIIVATTGRYFRNNEWQEYNAEWEVTGPWVGEVFWHKGWYNENQDGWMIANCDEEYGIYVEATHWMPLPEPPNTIEIQKEDE